jgi:cbb3-type cytochrome oxidase subunit 3
MYQLLRTKLGDRAADAIMVVWIAVLLALVVYFVFEPQAEFRYTNL